MSETAGVGFAANAAGERVRLDEEWLRLRASVDVLEDTAREGEPTTQARRAVQTSLDRVCELLAVVEHLEHHARKQTSAAWRDDAKPLPRDLPWPERRAVTSSNIAAVGQVEDVVVVEFTYGSIYAYAGAKEGLADELVAADSVGRQFYISVKGQFETTRLR